MRKPLVTYLASLLLFGSNGVIAAAIPLQSTHIVFLRTLIGGVFLVAALVLSGRKIEVPRSRRHLVFIAASGLCTGLSWVTLYEAYRLIGVSVSSLEYYCAPAIVMIASVPLFGERLTVRKVAGFFIVLAGTILVGCQTIGGGGSYWGLALGALSAIFHAGMVVFSKMAPNVKGLESSALQIVLSCAVSAMVLAATQEPVSASSIPPSAWPPLLVLGLANTGLGCYLYFSSIVQLPAQTVATLGYLEPLSAVAFSSLVLSETLTPLQWAGAALVIGGAVYSETKRKSARPRSLQMLGMASTLSTNRSLRERYGKRKATDQQDKPSLM